MSPSDVSLADFSETLPQEYRVELASLSDEAQEQVHDTVLDQGGAQHANLDGVIAEAKDADSHRETVEDLHKEQADAVDHGDYAKANDIAHQTEYEIKAVESDGGQGDQQLTQTYKDELNTSEAVYHQQLAADDADFARSDAAMGHDVAAADAADHAADHAHDADALASHADQGGSDADHGYSSESSTAETSE